MIKSTNAARKVVILARLEGGGGVAKCHEGDKSIAFFQSFFGDICNSFAK
jgi:hypothetical protein